MPSHIQGLSLSERFAKMKQQTNSNLTNNPNRLKNNESDVPKSRSFISNTPMAQRRDKRNDKQTALVARKIAAKAKNQLVQSFSRIAKKKNNANSKIGGYPLAAITQALLEANQKLLSEKLNNKNNTPNRSQISNKSESRNSVKAESSSKTSNAGSIQSRLGAKARLGKKLASNDLRMQSRMQKSSQKTSPFKPANNQTRANNQRSNLNFNNRSNKNSINFGRNSTNVNNFLDRLAPQTQNFQQRNFSSRPINNEGANRLFQPQRDFKSFKPQFKRKNIRQQNSGNNKNFNSFRRNNNRY